MSNVVFGADPEFTFFDKNENPVPAHRLGFKDKHNKQEIGFYATAHRDGTNLEVNFKEASSCRAHMSMFLQHGLQDVEKALPEGIKVRAKAAYQVDLDDLMSDAPEDVRYFGCDPAFDSYTGKAMVITVDAQSHPWRYAGGHMHFGTRIKIQGSDRIPAHNVLQEPSKYPRLGQLMDWLIGIPQTCIWNGAEQFERRKYYGRAGEFRPQRYNEYFMGFEYRTPPPDMWNHHTMVTLFYGVGKWIIDNFEALDKQYNPKWGPEIAKAINEGKDPEKFLTTVPELYDPDAILALRGIPGIYQWSIPSLAHDPHTGWTEYAQKWGIRLPLYEEKYVRIAA